MKNIGYIATTKTEIEYLSKGAWIPETPTEATVNKTPLGKLLLSKNNAITEIETTPKACQLAGSVLSFGKGILRGTSIKVKSENKSVILDTDIGECNGVFTNTTTGATTPCNCTIKIKNINQNKVRGL